MFSKTSDSAIIHILNVKDGKVQNKQRVCTKCGKLVCECPKKSDKERVDGRQK